jgi:hypothetical protein
MLTKSMCPPELKHHPNYTTMGVNYNAYGQVLYRYLHWDATISMTSCPSAYYELTSHDTIKCGWQLLQEWIWSCSPHMNGHYQYFRLQINDILPVANKMIFTFYHRAQELSHYIQLSCDTIGIQHEFMYHLVQGLCCNGNYGFTNNTLQAFLIKIRDMCWSPHHAQAPLLFTYHAVIDALCLADITRYHAITGS